MSRAFALALLALPLDALAGCLQLTELLPNPVGADAGFEWVEMYNRCNPSNSVNLANYVLRVGHASVTTDLPLSGTALGTRRFVVGEPSVVDADLTVPALNLRNAIGDAESLAIVRITDGEIQDTIVYGTPNTSGWIDDTGAVATSLAPSPAEGSTLVRVLEFENVEESGDAWLATTSPTPGASNAFQPATCSGGAGVRINELSSDPILGEWVELINLDVMVKDLSGWQLLTGVEWLEHQMALPQGTMLDPGARLVVASTALPFADVVDPLLVVPSVAASESAVVRLHRCTSLRVDTVVYGDPAGAAWNEDSGLVATSLAPAPSASGSVSRRIDGADTDVSGDDFLLTTVPTAGAPNLHLETTVAPVRGQTTELTVFNAQPGETVVFAWAAAAGAGVCLPQLGGECLGIVNPAVLGGAVADGSGTAALTLPVPGALPPITVYTQAAIVRGAGGADSVVTNVNVDRL